MKAIKLILSGMLVVSLGQSIQVNAEDIDVYSGVSTTAARPNVLFVLDNSASLDANAPTCNYADGSGSPSGTGIAGKLFGMEMCSLYNVIYALPTKADGSALVNIGFMYYNANGIAGYGNGNNNCQASSNNGGCLAKPLTAMSATNKSSLLTWIKSWTASAIKANNESTGAAMQEAWAYYSGKTGLSGLNYSNVKPEGSCAKNFVIFIGNAANNVSSPGDGASAGVSSSLTAAYSAAGVTQPGNITIPSGKYGLSPTSLASNVCSTGGSTYTMGTHNDSSGLYADEWARFMSTTSARSIITYTVGVLGPTACKPDYPALLTSMALYGNGKYYPTDVNSSNDLVQNILRILNEIQAVNSVFASSSLPVSVNAQGTYLNQVYMGMFRPDPNANPRWKGNLKQYQFILDSTGNLQLGDSLGNAALAASTTGFISPNAVSFWTSKDTTTEPDSSGGFWKNFPSMAHSAGVGYDLPDGEWVEKGGAAQQLRIANLTDVYTASPGSTSNPRKLYTYCPSGAGCGGNGTLLSTDAFDSSYAAITDALLGTGSRTVSSITSVATASKIATATVTTSGSHGFPDGAVVTIAGATPSGYNGTWGIAVTGSATFTFNYNYTGTPLASLTGSATASTTTRDNLAKWVRGSDNNGDETGPGGTINIRPSVHGDVLHNRPAVINYGGSTGVVVFYGENGGVYHAVDGNPPQYTNLTTNVTTVDPNAGDELWGFIPPEHFGKLLRLHDNSPQLLMPSTPAGILPAPTKKDYFVDGPTGVYQLLDSTGTTLTAYIYLTMRRGGGFIYALDVTSPTAPRFLWKKDNTSAGMSELGQTWSQPKVARVKGYTNPVLIFGAGYDNVNEDVEPPTADTKGRGIFILDAITGAVVWKATYGTSSSCTTGPASCTVLGMNYSIPADITLMDRNGDGYIDRLYAVDTGGNIWRVDLEPAGNSAPDNWQVNKLAALGCDTGPCASGTTPRKFFYPPEVISTLTYDAVIAGTGDREHPLYSNGAYSVVNRVYLLKDTATGDDGSGLTTLTEQTAAGSSNLDDCTGTATNPNTCSTITTGAASALSYDKLTLTQQKHGYYLTLNTGEKAVNAPLVTAGFVYFGTNQPQIPSDNSCTTNLGTARGYQVSPFNGNYGFVVFNGGGFPPSPVSGVVNIVNAAGTTTRVPFLVGAGNPACVGADCKSALGGQKPPINVSTSRIRTYWYMKGK